MNTKKKSVLGLLLLCCLLTFASLGVSAKKERSAAAMPVGKTQVISGYTVKSGNRKVLDVQKSGKKKYKVIPKKAGEATLSYYKGKTLKKKVSVLVYNKNTFRYDTSRLTLKQGSSRTCKAAAYKKCSVKYDTSDKKVATVSAGGRIKGVKKGTATISAKIFYKGQLVKTFRKKVTVTSGSSSGNGGKNETASKKPTCVKKATVYLDQFSDGDGYGALLDTDSSIYIKNLKSNAKNYLSTEYNPMSTKNS